MKIIITAGGTREYIDSVRFISNASTGKMGYAIAQAAVDAGHKVLLISAPTDLVPPVNVKLIKVISAAEMLSAVKNNFSNYNCLIMAAAVSDYTPEIKKNSKIKKRPVDLILKLKPTMDILKWAGKHKLKQAVIGFALEDRNILKNAEAKLKEKKLDAIIANSPDAIGADKSEIYIKTANENWHKSSAKSKKINAQKIVKLAERIVCEQKK